MENTTKRPGVEKRFVGARYFVFIAVSLLLLVMLNPIAYAEAERIGKSKDMIHREEVAYIGPDPEINWTVTHNIANGSEWRYFDYNLTWQPFFENNTDLNGILIHNLIAPLAVELDYDENERHEWSFGSFFRLTPEAIMDGVSEAWFRLPITDLPENSTISLKVWKIQDANAFNMSFDAFGKPSFNNQANAFIVHNLTSEVDGFKNTTTGPVLEEIDTYWPNYRRWLNISVPETNNTFWYNFTYFKACFGLFPNEYYFVEFDIDMWAEAGAPAAKMLISSGDLGDDYRNNSWLWVNDASRYMPVDLDTPILCTYGMSNGITGMGVRTDKNEASLCHFSFNASIPIHKTISVAGGYYYFNILMPFLINISVTPEVRIAPYVAFCNSSTSDAYFHRNVVGYQYYEATYNFFIKSIDLTTYDGEYIDHIRFDFQVFDNQTSDFNPNASAVKLWGMVLNDDHLHGGYTDLYWQGYYAAIPQRNWTLAERQWFIPYGYYSLDDSYWVNTQMPILVIPINTPKTPLEIQEALQSFQVWLHGTDRDGNSFWNSKLFPFEFNYLRAIMPLIDFVVGVVVGAMTWVALEIFMWVFDKWNDFVHDPPDWLLDILGVIYGIGQFLWKVVNLLFDALEWFCYWGVRIIYTFSLAVVYMVNIFGVISINSALLNVSKTGNGRDFIRAFRLGWKFILAIISLLLSMAIMAISIVSAVVPF